MPSFRLPFLRKMPQSLSWCEKRTFFSTFGLAAGTFVFLTDNIVTVQRVRGRSMAPSISPAYHETGNRDTILLEKLLPALELQRGDIVSFWTPNRPDRTAIKRVIATEGDIVYPQRRHPLKKVVIPHGHVWVEGDNHEQNASVDSNDYGPISLNLIDGKARAVVWPPSRMGAIVDRRSRRTRVEPGKSEMPREYEE
ncbi:LexA/Signal peptidase [Pseudovirgaria hyperparasitica]|uniref:Mitochondrial inner membrane protease subunit 2 n=1 Tax=Pseudovirgaria hyperparasitica TaxID=470096 RepID=A0A6A6WCA9_9PEZI|nr:LexA/Signal peptidase [Pseudovirgaria hyperparasitica]KAF2760468.1 LexA/Signal peptidase [Pseudovirgaria hyperparasitica]